MPAIHFRTVFIVLLISSLTVQNGEEEETNPFIDAAKSLLQDSLRGKQDGIGDVVGGMLQSFLQTDGGRQIGDMLLNSGASNVNATDFVSGIGSLLSGNKESVINPELLGHVVDMFANMGNSNSEDSNIDENNNVKSTAPHSDNNVNWESMLSLVTGLVSQNKKDNPLEGFMNILPVLMQTVSGGHHHQDDPELEDFEEHRKHEQASSFLPPFLANLYIYWDHFKDSELGRTLWTNSGLDAIFRLFTDKNGNFQIDRIFESMENASFRRRWVRSLTSFVADWAKHVSDPNTQARFLTMAQFVGNNFIQAQGYSRAVMFDPSRPAESLSLLANVVCQRHFGLKVNSATYIKPAVAYVQEVLRLGQSKGLSLNHLSSQDIENKLSETLNGEIIEPVLRVWRAYRFAIKNNQCDKYLICELNRLEPGSEGPSGLKPGITKLASLTASWFLSGKTGTPFWKLYNAAVENYNCQAKYPVNCSQFHEEDIKATTEYSHNEL